MPVGLSLRLESDPAKASRELATLGRRLMNFRTAWQRLVPELADGFRDVFSSQGAALGEKWAPLAESTIRYKRRGTGPLIGTGEVFGQMTSSQGVRQLTTRKLVFGPNIKRAFVHHYGEAGRLPSRYLVGWTPRMDAAADRIMAEHIDAAVKTAQRAMEA